LSSESFSLLFRPNFWGTNMHDSPTKSMRADNVKELDVLITKPKEAI